MGEGRVCQFFLQLVAQHLCFASWKALLPVSPLACATCCATTFSLANCSHMFHEVKDGSTFCNESWCLLIVLPLALQHATQQSRRKRFSLASPFKRAQVTSVRALTSQWTWWTKLMYSLRLGRLNYSTKNCLRLRTLTCTRPQKTIRQAFYYFHCEVSFIHTEIFTTKSVVSKPSSQLFTANQIWETTILHVEKTFRPITKNLPEVLGFHALSFSYPVSLLET